MRLVIDAFAEYERFTIGPRTKATFGAQKANGTAWGRFSTVTASLPAGVHLKEMPRNSMAARG